MNHNDNKQPANNNQQVEINEQRSRGMFSNNHKPLLEQNTGTTLQIEIALKEAKNDDK